MFQHFQRLNNEHQPPDNNEIYSIDLKLFVYPFSEKEIATIPVLPNTKDVSFGFNLTDDKSFGHIYICKIKDNLSSSASKSFGTCKNSCAKFCVA